MAQNRDMVGDWVRSTAKGLSDPFKSQREAAGRMVDSAKKKVRSYVDRYSGSSSVKAAERPASAPAKKTASRKTSRTKSSGRK